MLRLRSEILNLVGIALQIVELELRSLDVGLYGAAAIESIRSSTIDVLPGWRFPQVGSERKGQRMRDVPDQLVAPRADDAHRIVHGDLMKSMRGVHLVPSLVSFFVENRQEGTAMKLLFAIQRAGEIEDGRRNIDPTDHRLACAAAPLLVGGSHDAR